MRVDRLSGRYARLAEHCQFEQKLAKCRMEREARSDAKQDSPSASFLPLRRSILLVLQLSCVNATSTDRQAPKSIAGYDYLVSKNLTVATEVYENEWYFTKRRRDAITHRLETVEYSTDGR